MSPVTMSLIINCETVWVKVVEEMEIAATSGNRQRLSKLICDFVGW